MVVVRGTSLAGTQKMAAGYRPAFNVYNNLLKYHMHGNKLKTTKVHYNAQSIHSCVKKMATLAIEYTAQFQLF